MAGALDSGERALLDRCAKGDEAAWATVFRTYAPRVALFLRGMLGQSDVDDLVQRVFLEFVTSLPRFRGESSLSAWLHGIAHNLAHKEVRSLVRHRGKVTAFAAALDGAGDSAAPDGRVEARERLQRIAGALEGLDLRFRAVWVMREVEGLSVEEVATALGEREATVRTRHFRAREKVMEALAAMEGERGPQKAGTGRTRVALEDREVRI